MRGTRRVVAILLAALVVVPLVGIELLTSTAAGAGITFYSSGLTSPFAITRGPDNALWFTDTGTNAIGRITSAGTVTEYTDPTISTSFDIVTGSDGALWFTNSPNNSIGRIDPTTHVITNYTDSINNTIASPYGIASGSDGALWFTNVSNNSIGRIDPTTHVITNFVDAINNSIASPNDITAGPDGALWFTNNSGNSIGRMTTAGAVTAFPIPGVAAPYAITAGPDGALWFTNLSDDSIGRLTTSGAFTKYAVPNNNSSSTGGIDITTGPDGALWFTNNGGSGTATIGRISTAGLVTVYDTPSPHTYSLGIAAGFDGSMWFGTSGAIGQITTDSTGTCGAACTDVVAKPGVQVVSDPGPPTDAQPTKQTLTLPNQSGAAAVRVRFKTYNPGPNTSAADKLLCPVTGKSKCSGQISVIAGNFTKYTNRANPIRVKVLARWKNGIPPGALMLLKDNGAPPIHLAKCVRKNGLYNTPCALPETDTGTKAQHNQVTTDTFLFVGNDPHVGRRASNIPDAPVAVSATAGKKQATVHWKPPTVTSGKLTGYLVTPRRGTARLTPVAVAAGKTSVVIKKLVTATAYTFIVQAKNSRGISLPSLASKAVKPK